MPDQPTRNVPLHATLLIIEAAKHYVQQREANHPLVACLADVRNDLQADYNKTLQDDET